MANKINIELSMQTTAYQQGMQQAIDSTAAYETETRKVQDSTVNLNKELRKAKQEAQNLAAGFARLSKEEKDSQFGKEMARQLQEAKQKAAEYIDLQGDLNTELRNMASDTATFDAVADGLSGLGHTMSAVTGVMGIFTDDTEMMTRAVTMFTTAESIASAAIKVKNLLQRQSSLMLGIGAIQQKALTAAENLDTVAKSENAAAATAATAAQAALNAVAKANPYILLATAILAVVSALAIFSDSDDEAAKKQEILNNRLSDGTTQAIEFANAMNSAYSVMASYAEMIGSATHQIEDIKLEGATKKLQDLWDVYQNTLGSKDPGESIDNYKNRVDAAYKAWHQALQDKGKLEDEINNRRRAVQTLLDNWDTLKTEKQIRAAISAFQNLRSEYNMGSKEYNELTRRIEILQKKVDPNKIVTPKVETKHEIKTYEEAINEYDRLTQKINNLNKYIEEGRIDSSDIEKFKKEIVSAQDELNNISSKWHIKAKVELEQPQKADLDKIRTEIENAINPKIEKSSTYNFSTLPKEFSKVANDTVASMKKIEIARNNLTKIMQTSESDKEIAAAQQGIDQLNTAYDELASKADIYQELSDEADKLNKKNEKIAETLSGVGQAFNEIGNIMKSLGSIFDDKVLNAAGIIAQAVATYILGWTEATAKAAKLGPIGWAAFGLSTAAQALAVIEQIKSAGKYAQGGIISGSSYSGDRLLAQVNSGEMILNSRQQKNLFDALDLDSTGGKNNHVEFGEVKLRGSDLYILFKNYEKTHSMAQNKNIRA